MIENFQNNNQIVVRLGYWWFERLVSKSKDQQLDSFLANFGR